MHLNAGGMRGGLPFLPDGTVGADSQLGCGGNRGASAGCIGRTKEQRACRNRHEGCRASRQNRRDAKTTKARLCRQARCWANLRRNSNQCSADGTGRTFAEFRAGDGGGADSAGSGRLGIVTEARDAFDEWDCARNRTAGARESAAETGNFAECFERRGARPADAHQQKVSVERADRGLQELPAAAVGAFDIRIRDAG